MSRLRRPFVEHPASVGETYLEHMRTAIGFTLTMIRAALCCGIHAFLPFLFQRTGSAAIEDLHRRMVRARARRAAGTQDATPRRAGPADGSIARSF